MSKVVYDSTRRMNCCLVKGKIEFPLRVFDLKWDKIKGGYLKNTRYDEARRIQIQFEEKGIIVLIREDSISDGLGHIHEAVRATISPTIPAEPEVSLKIKSFECMGEVVVPVVQEEGLHFSHKLYPSDLSPEEQLRRIRYISKKFSISQTESRMNLAETDWVVTKAEDKIVREVAALKAGESQANRSGGFEG